MSRLPALALILLACALRLAAGDVQSTASSAQRVAYIPIHGEIDPLQARYFRRAVNDAVAAKVDAVVVHLTTPGGRVDSAIDMVNTAMGVAADGPLMVAFIDDHAYSAGSLITYGHRRIYLTNAATIGDIGVIYHTSDGKMEYAPEKAETVVRALLRSVAQKNGWNEAKLVKMTARNQTLYRFDLPAGQEFVIEDDLPRWLADHPGVDPDSKIRILGEDRLLSFTAKEAVDQGMATALVGNLDEVYGKLGASPAAVLDLSPTSVERMSWLLAGWAPILAGLAVLFLVLEFKMPSGLWIGLAALCGAAFFVCQFYQDLANYVEVILVILGVACVVVELFVFPIGGWLAMLGLGLTAVGLVLAFMPDAEQFHPSDPNWGRDLGSAVGSSLLALIILAGGLVVLIMTLPNLRLINRIAATAEITGTSAGPELTAHLVGQQGIARTQLSPSGFVVLDGRELSATTEHGEFIKPGSAVEVVELRFGEAIVRASAPAPDQRA